MKWLVLLRSKTELQADVIEDCTIAVVQAEGPFGVRAKIREKHPHAAIVGMVELVGSTSPSWEER